MMLWGCYFPLIHNDAVSSLVGILWIGGWMLFSPLKKWLELRKLTPKLDAKYPLTVNRIDKNQVSK